MEFGYGGQPHTGIQSWRNQNGICVFRLHYSADDAKTSEWAAKQKARMTNAADYEQEYEINFSSKLGTLVYQLKREATLCNSFPIPRNWTRYMMLDPHPVVPHAFLWVAVDKWQEGWAYRELWPSKIYGRRGNVPEDDNRFGIKHYVETVKWLESADNPENDGIDEDIYRRIIDYAARAMGQGFFDDKPEYNFQKRYEDLTGWTFTDCIKDNNAGPEAVNQWLKPRDIEQEDGSFKPLSRLHIFQDRCPELIYELETNRLQQLTPIMADRSDPTGKPQAKRNHVTDDLKYWAMSEPEYIAQRKVESNWKPVHVGINF